MPLDRDAYDDAVAWLRRSRDSKSPSVAKLHAIVLLAALDELDTTRQMFADLYDEISVAQRIDNTGGDSAVSIALWGFAERRAALGISEKERTDG